MKSLRRICVPRDIAAPAACDEQIDIPIQVQVSDTNVVRFLVTSDEVKRRWTWPDPSAGRRFRQSANADVNLRGCLTGFGHFSRSRWRAESPQCDSPGRSEHRERRPGKRAVDLLVRPEGPQPSPHSLPTSRPYRTETIYCECSPGASRRALHPRLSHGGLSARKMSKLRCPSGERKDRQSVRPWILSRPR